MLEGDAHDRELSRDYFDAHGIQYDFITFSNELLPFLKGKNSEGKFPSLIILSMRSVPQTGLEILKQVKSVPALNPIPVIVLGESTDASLIRECYAAGASTFINKPLTSGSTDFSITTFLRYWFEVAELQSNTAAKQQNVNL